MAEGPLEEVPFCCSGICYLRSTNHIMFCLNTFHFSLQSIHLEILLKQVPSHYILLGSFNGHNSVWGCSENSFWGKPFQDFINKCLMIGKSCTYIHPETGKLYSLDISLCHSSLYLEFEWRVIDSKYSVTWTKMYDKTYHYIWFTLETNKIQILKASRITVALLS